MSLHRQKYPAPLAIDMVQNLSIYNSSEYHRSIAYHYNITDIVLSHTLDASLVCFSHTEQLFSVC